MRRRRPGRLGRGWRRTECGTDDRGPGVVLLLSLRSAKAAAAIPLLACAAATATVTSRCAARHQRLPLNAQQQFQRPTETYKRDLAQQDRHLPLDETSRGAE